MPLVKHQWHLHRFAIMVPKVGLEPTRYRYQRILSFCLRYASIGLHRYRVESKVHHQIAKPPDFRAFPPKIRDVIGRFRSNVLRHIL